MLAIQEVIFNLFVSNSKALSEADVLLRMKHGMVRLDSVWGVVGGRRPVKHLVKKVSYHIMIIRKYICYQ